jgi:hypothetical protein
LCNGIYIVVVVWIKVIWDMTPGHFKPLKKGDTFFKQICPASFHETCQWLKFPLNGLWAQKKTLKKTRIKLYNTLALPVLLHGCKTWTFKARDTRRITAAEMKYMRRTEQITSHIHKLQRT